MKKLSIVVLTLLLSSICLTAQKQTQAEINASKTINMTNTVVDLYNNYLSNIKKVREGLQRAEENIEILKENINRSAHGWNCTNMILHDDMVISFEKACTVAPAFAEKAKIQAEIKYAKANGERLSNHCKALNDYFNKKEYKEDEGFAKFQPLYDSLYNVYKDVSKSWLNAVNLASEAGNKSELVLLKKSPVAEFIIPMKTDLSAVSKLIDMFTEEEADFNAIQKDIEALKISVAKNKSLTGKNVANLEKYSNKLNYEGYYQSMDEAIEIAAKIEELMNPDKVKDGMNEQRVQDEIENKFSMLNWKYKSLVESYNMM